MTITDDRLDAILDLAGDGDGGRPPREVAEPVEGAGPSPAVAEVAEAGRPKILLTCAATALSSLSAGWMAAALFAGLLPRLLALIATAYGVGVTAASYRTRRTGALQYVGLAGTAVLGAAFVLPDATGGSANLPGLVVEAVRNGGISQPPVPFDPGWKFLLTVLVGAVSLGSSAVALELRRPKLGVVLPVPVTIGTLFLQPRAASGVPTIVSLMLAVGGLTVAYGADLAREGATSSTFEIRRFLRGAGVMAGVVALLAGLSQLGFLFPPPRDDQEIPPKRPEPPPPAADRELFTVESSRTDVPWRLGTLDVYADNAWMTPPFSARRLLDVGPGGALRTGPPGAVPGAPVAPVRTSGEPVTATFRITDIDGRVIPTLANASELQRSSGFAVQHDPRTQSLRLDRRASRGLNYTIQAPAPASAAELATAGPPPPSMREFLEVPAPPREVAELLAQAPTPAFERLQFLRNAFYAQVVAAGAGNPIDVPPARVAEMLSGKEATPYEITAGEALLARWAGVPARIGYGYFGGDDAGGGKRSVRPVHGSSWLEAYFDGFGWVPIIGRPPKAKSGLNDAEKKKDPTVRPTDELATVVYVPMQGSSIVLLFTVVRYWIAKLAPWVVAGGLIWWLHPGLLKMARRLRRERWARRGDPSHRLAVAYAEWRDLLSDYNIGHHSLTPVELVDELKPDAEHAELAWLVTRGLWGDLQRDLRPSDAEAAEEMSQSLRRRLRRSMPGLFSLLAFASRASIRDPYSREVPNFRLPRPRRPALGRPRLRRRGVLRPAAAVPLLVLALLLTGCVQRVSLGEGGRPVLPASLAPDRIADVTFRRNEKAEAAYREAGPRALVDPGQVFDIEQGSKTLGTLQIAPFKPGLRSRRREVRAGVLQTLGGSRFKLEKVGGEKIYRLRVPEQQMLLWFPPAGRYYELMVVRGDFEEAPDLFAAVLAYQRGDVATTKTPRPTDPRRGRQE